MAAQVQAKKVLRIGIIQDGKIVQERLIKAGEQVSVGDGADNTFVFPKTRLPSTFEIFRVTDDGYSLTFTEDMKGKISSGGAVVGLEKLRDDPSVTKEGEFWHLPLTQQDRGKVSVDNVTVLFQFVSPPPVQAVKPLAAMDFRPRLLEDDDPVFLGFMSVFTGLAAVLMVWVWNAPPPREITADEIPDRFTQLLLAPPEVIETPEIETEIIDPNQVAEVVNEDVVPERATETPEQEPRTEIERAQSASVAAAEVMERSLMIAMITTTGANGVGVAADLFGEGDAGIADLDAALREVGGVEVATAIPQGQRGGSGTGNADVDIGDLAGVAGGSSEVGGGPELQVQGDVNLGSGQLDEGIGDADAVRATVRANFGQLQYCYEQQLRSNPSLAGRVEVEWYVRERRVTSATVFANTTSNAALGDCIVGKIKRWRFGAGVEGEILYPFVFTPKG